MAAKTKYKVHSPFVFTFLNKVLDDTRHFYDFDLIHQARSALLKNTKKISVTDFGAGSFVNTTKERRIKDLAKNAGVRSFWGKVLFKMILLYKPKSILEIGSSLGISTLFLSLPDPKAQVLTIEGCPNTAKFARFTFDQLEVNNVKLINGKFEDVLPVSLNQLKSLDFVLFDGNHQKEPTLDYFNQCLGFRSDKTVFCFDDIYWSDEMVEAWQEIKNHPDVTLSLDLFQFGLVFFDKKIKEKQHLKLIPYRWKFWQLY